MQLELIFDCLLFSAEEINLENPTVSTEIYFCDYQKNSTKLKSENIVEDCGQCEELRCKKSRGLEEKECMWNDYTGSCVPPSKVSCGEGAMAPDCGQCGSSLTQCRGECYWKEEVGLCVHADVFGASPYIRHCIALYSLSFVI